MKVLLSAYACEPNKGSEPGVGWHWAQEIAKLGHEVWVLTRANNRTSIEAALAGCSVRPENLHFVYYDLPSWMRFWKKGLQGVHLYYFLWQFGAYLKARKLCRQVQFDLVHHITFVSIRQPSFMGFLGLPFIFGPLAGGERIPRQLYESLPLQGKWTDWLRDLVNGWASRDPLMHFVFQQAKAIYVTSPQTLNLLPKRFHRKAKTQLAIGIEPCTSLALPQSSPKATGLKLLYVGRLLYWKGLHLGLEAFASFLKQYPDSRLTIIGQGPDELWLKEKATQLELGSSVEWVPWMKQDQLARYYAEHDLFLFPSFRDSGGMVVPEAMSYGLPVVCLNLGGPGVMVDETCGFRVEVEAKGESVVIQDLFLAMASYYRMSEEEKEQLRKGAQACVEQITWQKIVAKIYKRDMTELAPDL